MGAEAERRFRIWADERLQGLLRYAYVLTGDADAAHDLVQTALAKTIAAWDGLRNTVDPEGYVRTAMAQLCANERRRRDGGSARSPSPERATRSRMPARRWICGTRSGRRCAACRQVSGPLWCVPIEPWGSEGQR